MASPRITTSLSPETRAALLRWGQRQGLSTVAEITRAFIAAHLAGGGLDERAFRAAREQALAELREASHRLQEEIARRLPTRR